MQSDFRTGQRRIVMPDFSMKDFYKSGHYVEAIAYAENINIREGFNEWDYLFLSNCFYKLERYSDCLKIYKEFHSKFPESDLLNDKMGWCAYFLHIKNFDFENMDKEIFFRQVDYVLSHSSDSQYSPRKKVVEKAVNAIFKGKVAVNIDYDKGNKYLSYINPILLDNTEQVKQDQEGNLRRFASPREQWYNRKTKALVELKQYDECLKFIEQAFLNVKQFHNNAEHWLNYKKAQCFFSQEKFDEADKIINSILSKFQHWCFYEIMFDICLKKKDTNNALKYGAFCSTADREHKTRVNFYVRYAKLLNETDQFREAALHFRLVELIRAEEDWRQQPLPNNFKYPDDILHMDKRMVIGQLNDFWRKEKEKDLEFYEGTIDKLLPNGKSGFVKDQNGKSYYFNVRDFDKRDARSVVEGLNVRFALIERLDKKKNEMKLNAISISIVR